MTIRYISNELLGACGTDIKDILLAIMNGYFWDDNAHTFCNANRIIGGRRKSYYETRNYAPKIEYCYNKFNLVTFSDRQLNGKVTGS
jgi:hypothetical protein